MSSSAEPAGVESAAEVEVAHAPALAMPTISVSTGSYLVGVPGGSFMFVAIATADAVTRDLRDGGFALVAAPFVVLRYWLLNSLFGLVPFLNNSSLSAVQGENDGGDGLQHCR